MVLLKNILLCEGLIYLIGCGVEVGNPKNPKNPDPINETYLTDNEAVKELALVQIEDSQAALSGYQTDESLNLMGPNLDIQLTDLQRQTSCTRTGDKITSSFVLKGSKERLGTRRSIDITYNTTADINETFEFSDFDNHIFCSLDAKNVRMMLAKIKGYTLVHNLDRSGSFEIQKRKNAEVLRKQSYKMKGRRNSTVTIDRSVAGIVRTDSTVTSSAERTLTFTTKKKGEHTVETAAETLSPMVISQSFQNGSWTEKTLNKGIVRTTLKDDSVLQLEYKGVSFKQADGCYPVSGSITGKIFVSSKDQEPSNSFVIDFAADGKLVFADGQSYEVEVAACEIEP